MAFFDKLGSTITSKSKDVAQKAKEIAEVASLNGQISTQEDIVNKTYTELGKMMYEQKSQYTHPDFTARFQQIDAAMIEIERLKREIMVIKKTRQCPGCGAAVDNNAAFCPSCGASMPVQEEASADAPAADAVIVEPAQSTDTEEAVTVEASAVYSTQQAEPNQTEQ